MCVCVCVCVCVWWVGELYSLQSIPRESNNKDVVAMFVEPLTIEADEESLVVVLQHATSHAKNLSIDPLHIMGMQSIWRTKQKKFSLLGIEVYSHFFLNRIFLSSRLAAFPRTCKGT